MQSKQQKEPGLDFILEESVKKGYEGENSAVVDAEYASSRKLSMEFKEIRTRTEEEIYSALKNLCSNYEEEKKLRNSLELIVNASKLEGMLEYRNGLIRKTLLGRENDTDTEGIPRTKKFLRKITGFLLGMGILIFSGAYSKGDLRNNAAKTLNMKPRQTYSQIKPKEEYKRVDLDEIIGKGRRIVVYDVEEGVRIKKANDFERASTQLIEEDRDFFNRGILKENYSSPLVVVDKKSQTLYLYRINIIKEDEVCCSTGIPRGNKQRAGDHKTPEGLLYVKQINDSSTWSVYDSKKRKKLTFWKYFFRIDDRAGTYKNINGNTKSPIGIHGTNEPELLGQRASHGCIRVNNRFDEYLHKRIEEGTPVVILNGE